ncbi:MAG: LCCL domain-containing protein, partial [bacterium]
IENQKWGGACDVCFSNDSADVSCRQMGFDTGRWYKSQDAAEWKLDAKDNSPFTASNIECTGQEGTIKDCNYIRQNISCDHTHDIVIACKGSGDPTGQTQIKPKVVTPTPDLGRLGMLYIRVNCAATGKDKRLRGDPGSVYIIECQPGCDKQRGSVTGTGVYSSDSNICVSACHAGIFPCETGGEGVLVKTYGQKYYEATVSNGVQSNERLAETDVSFTFTRKWSNYQKYSNLLQNNNLSSVNHQNVMQRNFLDRIMNGAADRLNTILTGTAQERMDYHKNQGTSYSPSLNLGPNSLDAQIPDTFKVDVGGANLTGGLSPISFLEMNLNQSFGSSLGPVAFKWSESIGTHRFDSGGMIMKSGRPMKALEKLYSMFAAFSMDFYDNDDEYIFSYGGCGGFNIWIDTSNSLNLGDPCDGTKKIDTGFKVPKKDKCYLYIGYDNSKLKVRFKEKNNFSSIKQRDFEFKLTIPERENLCIGCRSADQAKPFFGAIDFIIFYDTLVPEFAIGSVIREIENEKKSSDNVNNFPITEDGRKCVSSPMLAPTPGQPGAPTPPSSASPYVGSESPQNAPLGDNPDSFIPSVSDGNPASDDFKNFSLLETNARNKGLWDTIKKGAKKVKDWLFGGKKNGGGSSASPSADENGGGPDSQSSDEANIGSIKVDGETTAMEDRFFNKKGKIFRISCGSCSNARYPVIGSGNYHPKSS